MQARPDFLSRNFIQYSLSQASDVLPKYAAPKTWITALRVLILFAIPLLLGALIGKFDDALSIALASGMLALADPRGSIENRSITVLGACIIGAIMLSVGKFVGSYQLGMVFLACAMGFMQGMLNNFGTAGVRAGFFVISCTFMGVSSGTGNPTISHMDILSSGVWCVAMALLFFESKPNTRRSFPNQFSDMLANLKGELLMKTPIGRMAYREMISAGFAVIIVFLLGRNNPEWAATAAIALYWPTSPVLYKRGIRFVLATLLAVILCFVFITFVKDVYLLAIFVGVFLFATTAMRESNYAAFSFTNTIFYILIIMLASGVGGIDLLSARIVNVVIGISVAMIVAMFTLPAKERIALLYEMELPLPLNEHIDDPYLASVRTRQVISQIYKPNIIEHLREIEHFTLTSQKSDGDENQELKPPQHNKP